MDRRIIPMEAAPELRSVLMQRLRISERGGPGAATGAQSTSPTRLPQPATVRTTTAPLTVRTNGPPPTMMRPTRPTRSPAQGNRSTPNSIGTSPRHSNNNNSTNNNYTNGFTGAHSNLEQKVSQLTARNEQLMQEVEAMRTKGVQDATSLFCEERQQLLAHTEQLITQSDQLMVARQHRLIEQQREVNAEASELRALQAETGRKVKKLEDQVSELRKENEALTNALEHVRRSPSPAPPFAAGGGSSSSCSGCRLRAVMTSRSATPEDLRSAICAAESLLDEARRELANKEHRQRRAAFERLHHAMDARSDEAELEGAIAQARAAGVDEHDIQSAEKMLAELHAMTPEERAKRALRELEAKRKKEAYYLVKKDDAEGLATLLEGLEEGLDWQAWRDYAGRTLRRCAQELRASKAEAVLVARQLRKAPKSPTVATASTRFRRSSSGSMGSVSSETSPPGPDGHAAEVAHSGSVVAAASAGAPAAGPTTANLGSAGAAAATVSRETPGSAACVSRDGCGEALEGAPAGAEPAVEGGQGEVAGEAERLIEPPSPEEAERLKANALRAVVRNDCAALLEVLDRVPQDMWSRWENRAGKDLLTLSQERGSSSAYSVLANALGLIKEVKRDTFEERETVWVFIQGDVQPHRATVLEDTSAEADSIYVEWWDGDGDPEYVDRCCVRKMWS